MPGKQKAKDRLDYYYELAKTMGYRSRASFKLIQLNRKYDFLSKAKTLVDLCAAPGSWTQVASKEMPSSSTIIAVDLVKIAAMKNVKTLVGDITTDKTRAEIKQLLNKKKCEVVIHDGAPNVGGAWAKDAFGQNLLTLKASKLACELLQPDGWFITKVFRSTDSNRLLYVLKQLFEKVEQFKPKASRQQSAEVFFVCAGYKAPKKLDPSMFSQKTVFEEMEDGQALDKDDPLAHINRKGHRKAVGYAVGKMLLHSKASVRQFLEAEDPKQFLNTYNEIVWEEGDEDLKNHKSTNEDVIEDFKDLQVISQWNKNKLIKWARNINREIAEEAGDIRAAGREANQLEAEFEEKEENEEEKLQNEIAAMHKRHEKAKKRSERKMIDRKLLQAERLGYNPADHMDDGAQNDFFEFSKMDLGNAKADIDQSAYDEHAEVGKDTRIASLNIHARDEEGRDMVMDADRESEDEDEDEDEGNNEAEQASDDEEEELVNPRNARTAAERAAVTTGDYYKSIERVLDNAYKNKEDYESDETMTDDDDDSEVEPEKWLDSSEEGDSSTEESDEDSDSIAEERRTKRVKPETTVDDTKNPEEDAAPTLQQSLRVDRIAQSKKNKRKGPGGFEEIPAAMRDPETRARTLAIGTQMLDKRRKREILEAGIHRFCHADEGLPKWFTDDEKRHNVRPLPITKMEVDDQKSRFKEINARPSKKEAEAVARRRKRAAHNLERIMRKEKSDPRLKGTTEGLTVRRLMRGQELRRKKKKVAQDGKSKGEERLAKKKEKFNAKKGGKGGKNKRKRG